MKKLSLIMLIIIETFLSLYFANNTVFASSTTVTSISSNGSNTYGSNSGQCSGSRFGPCTVHHFKVTLSDKTTISDALCGTPSYGTPVPASFGSKMTVDTLDDENIKKIVLVSPIGPQKLRSKFSWPSTTYTFSGNYARASCLINYKKKLIPGDYGDKGSATTGGAKRGIVARFPGFTDVVSNISSEYDSWMTTIDTFFDSDSTDMDKACKQQYLTNYTVKRSAAYSENKGADTGQAIIWLEGSDPTCVTETTSSYSVKATVTDGTTQKDATDSTSASPHKYLVSNDFSSLTLTFGGTITRGPNPTYTNNVDINYAIGSSTPADNALSDSVAVGESANTTSNNIVRITPSTTTTSTTTTGNSLTIAPGGTTPNICRTIKISPKTYSSKDGGSGTDTSTVCAIVHRIATASFSSVATVTDGTTIKNSGNSTSSSPHIYDVAGGNNLTLTFGGTISRASSSTYTGTVAVKYGLGTSTSIALSDSSPTVSLSSTTTSGKTSSSDNLTVTVRPTDATHTSTSTDTSKDTLYLAPGETTPNICRSIKIDPTSYSTNGGNGGTETKTVCVKVRRDTIAKFTASDVSISSTDSGLVKIGSYYYTFSPSGQATFTIGGMITRQTASDGDSYSNNAASRYNLTTSSLSTKPYDISATSPNSGALARGGSVTETNTVIAKWGETAGGSALGKGAYATICAELYFDSQITYRNGTEASRDQASATHACTRIYRFSDTTFTGTTALGVTDSNLACEAESNDTKKCRGKPTVGSYSVTFNHSITRSADVASITDAAYKYQVFNNSNTSETDAISNKTLKVNVTKVIPNVKSVSVDDDDTVDQTTTYCQYIKYNASSTYLGSKLINPTTGAKITSSNLTMDSRSTQKCVEITRPHNVMTYAKFTGSDVFISSTDSGLVKIGSYYYTFTPSGQATFTIGGKITRQTEDNGDSYSSNAASRYNLTTASLSTKPYNITSSSPNSGALARGGNISKTNTIVVKWGTNAGQAAITAGDYVTVCSELYYDSQITYRNGTEASRDQVKATHACTRIYYHPDTPVYFDGSSAAVLGERNRFTERNGAYYLQTASSDDKYLVNFTHTLKRRDVENYASSDQKRYVTSDVSNNYSVVDQNGNIAKKNENGTNVDVRGTLAFGITNTGIGDSRQISSPVSVYLPLGTKKRVCEHMNYDGTVTIRYSTQGIVSTVADSSTDACVTLANPIYEYEYRNPYDGYITITPSTGIEQVTNVLEATGNSRTTGNANSPSVYMKHTLERGVDGFEDIVSPSYTGKIGLSGATLSTSASGSTGDLASGESWNSSRVSNSSSAYTNIDVKAGIDQSKVICSTTKASPGLYSILFGDRYRRETYTDGTETSEWEKISEGVRIPTTTSRIVRPVNGSDSQKYANPISPKTVPNSDITSERTCVTITRPYNFKVTDISPTGTDDPLDDQEEASSPTFTVNISRNEENDLDYITDLSSKLIKVITFVIGADTDRASAGNLLGGGTRNNDNFCSSSNYTVKVPLSFNCQVGSLSASDTDSVTRVGTEYYSYDSFGGSPENPDQTITISRNAPSDLDIGDKFCIAVAVSPISDSDNDWRVSQAYCRTKGKKPTMQVWGGSVLATSGINTSYTKEVSSGKYFGSWGDFSLISGGEIKKMASGAAFSGGRELSSETAICDYSPLTIANENCSEDNGSTLGQATLVRDDSKFYTRIKNNLIPAKAENTYYTKGYGFESFSFLSESFGAAYPAGSKIELYYKPSSVLGSGTLQVPTSTRLGSGGSQPNITNSWNNAAIFYSPGNMEVTRNMVTVANNISTLSDISTFILIADGDIIIDQDVTRLDAWIIAGGTLNTCSINGVAQTPGSSDFNSDTCSQPLEINGPVYADNIVLSRTSGADYSSLSSPAERIDYNSSFLLWSYFQSSRGKFPQTTYLRELSPRF